MFELKILDDSVERLGILPCFINYSSKGIDNEIIDNYADAIDNGIINDISSKEDMPFTVTDDGNIIYISIEEKDIPEKMKEKIDIEEGCKGEIGIEESYNEICAENEKLDNSNIIRNISYDQSEILHNIMELYNEGKPFECDITASELKFYKKSIGDKYEIPVPNLLFDVYPQSENIKKITPFKRLPIEDNSLESIVVDLPFVISPHNAPSAVNPKDGSALIFKRFSGFYPVGEMYSNYYWWISEAFRVLKEGGICIWKTQSTISGGLSHWTSPFSFMCAQKVGFYVLDQFILEAKARLVSSGKYKKQQHARKYTSDFWVFQKNAKLAKKTDCFKLMDEFPPEKTENMVWEVK